ncbi:hypothetical protein ACP70R_023355 [Stipagrostis hirtigluma subsp. patula]
MIEVATGLAYPGRMLHSQQPLADYAKVEVAMVQEQYSMYELDMPSNEVKVPGEAINHFIAWHLRHIVLRTQPEPSQLSQPSPLSLPEPVESKPTPQPPTTSPAHAVIGKKVEMNKKSDVLVLAYMYYVKKLGGKNNPATLPR